MVRNRAPGVAVVPEPVSAVDTLHGRPVPDPYRWLETSDSPETLRWLEERGREYDREASTWHLREHLARRIRALVATDLWTPPVHRPGALFCTVRPAGSEHPRLVVFPASPEARGSADGCGEPRTVYDPCAEDPTGRTTLDAWEPSPDGVLVAVQTSSGGVERGGLRVIRADTGAPVGPTVPKVRYSHVAWLPGTERSFYYVRRDGAQGVRGVWLRRVADGAETLVYSCAGTGTVPGVRVLDGRWLLVTEGHGTGHRTDLWLADLRTDPPEKPVFRALQAGPEAETEVRPGPDGVLYLRTTLDAPRRRVCAVDPGTSDELGPEHWREVVAEDPGATLDAFCPFRSPDGPALLVVRTRLGISAAAVHDAVTGAPSHRVELPGEGMVSGPVAAPDGTLYLGYADVATQQRVLRLPPGRHRPGFWPPEPSGPGTSNTAPAVTRTVVWCRSEDGTRVPITVFDASGRPGASDDSDPGPTLLHAYGGFGRPRQFGFSATVLAWLLSGGRYAVAHVRGGGDAGRRWHLEGSGRHKPRAVQDLVAAADALVSAGWCTRAQLCLSGGSAGGLLVLAAATARPDLCAAVIASAPLADMARFERMGLGRMWTREFGTAADPDDFAALMSYSPYHRALDSAVRTPGLRHPSVLLTGFDGDTRTDAAHPRKMCAALLAAAGTDGDRPAALLRYERDVGHGPRAVSRAVGLAADAHAFAAHRTGLTGR
ncbi:prolyl oligopeptidase family serine peptidase [Nocardiopsis exhalans]|uniref:prolyl oligopeptidase n=1 Tax=Nocardiopsis exhalans TaxID=163604 RepID=A0ABY5DHE5_9ACTN|nr:prolyl oligopeptidase family serine peptidase [Nocardiopsis exhalans]USY22613.1 prolyl oligopeptidase family serine peptidase [Nocardiopsis exhalans]